MTAVEPRGSAYGSGAPTYESADLQRDALDGRIKVATSIRDAAAPDGAGPNPRRHRRWSQILDELLDRRLETRGR